MKVWLFIDSTNKFKIKNLRRITICNALLLKCNLDFGISTNIDTVA